ncbi:hypothetical protein FUT83_10735 [Treponema phagedenis]|uniref:Transposase n=2 Tax=Treponema phagedenis TaxID=162 RepID=A0AAE6IVJ4_TREPH|nr:hypothetical protein [Treponema phagedenis]NVP23592.1 hypothetical protein [Treponema phagedenis]QEJ98726.1 hypothetical protein FUT82_12450 [Treponema phagedenis]QEK04231.1 hypothetical protein FUT83_10735 [Treponema phagedenis]QEK09846.1 hypothetical protein FUT81_10650 [Treponema phagedenis]QLC58424.1 hypothetical protein HW453_06060 [Treponema phagedenis]
MNIGSISSATKSHNIGYFYLKDILDSLNLRSFFREKTRNRKIEFSPISTTMFMTYSRILDPKSKLGAYDDAKTYYNIPKISFQDQYKTLDIISENLLDFQTHLYKESQKIVERNTEVLYYDCTNFFFDINFESNLKKYGISKENRPNPIVQFGLFMDGNGIPLAFCVTPGNTNEQKTAIPLEEKLIKDFKLGNFVYVADAGLGSNKIRLFNHLSGNDFLVVQSLKRLKKDDLELALDENNWFCPSSGRNDININYISDDDEKIYFKSFFINNPIDIGIREFNEKNVLKKKTDFKQRLIVSFSKKQQLYQRQVRAGQVLRAKKMVSKKKMGKQVSNLCR